ncbi:hypothetical protein [Coleofasciculus sp.]|uniref:hypothetical protein n=1 Tax=Coleofasciculus sp. TaxID=3100458 RepID=UPI003A260F47
MPHAYGLCALSTAPSQNGWLSAPSFSLQSLPRRVLRFPVAARARHINSYVVTIPLARLPLHWRRESCRAFFP